MSGKALQYVEIDVDTCSLTYGIRPCSANNTPPISATKLLLNFEATPGSTVFTDTSPSARGNAAFSGGAVIGGTDIFGGNSAFFPAASNSVISYPNSSDFDFGTGDFTIDWWEYRLDTNDTEPIASRDSGSFTNVGGYQAFLVGWSASGVAQFYSSSNGTAWDIANGVLMGTLVANTWVHRAVTRSGNTFRTFENGVIKATFTSSLSLYSVVTGSLLIGAFNANNHTYFYNGFLDSFRITKGVARWTSTFNPSQQTDAPITGSIKCFNTMATCQDRQHFTNVPVTLRFAVPTNYLPPDIPCIPSIDNIEFDPAVISLGEDLGQRATLTVSFDDHRHSDSGAGFDKYLSERPYDPYAQGTFWGKFRARQTFLRGRNLRWINGTLGDALADMETRHYIIDSFSGPDNNGKFQIIAKDLLKLADGDRAMAPRVSNGYLNSALAAGTSSFAIVPVGVGAEYPAGGYIAIGGSEICSFSRSGDTFSLGRGQLGTTAQDHSAQDRVQLVITYSALSPDVIINDLLQNYAGVGAQFIPLATWSAEITTYLNRLYTAVIPQPTSVNTLISELIEQAGLSMWWDDRAQTINMLVLRGLIYTTYLFSEDNVIGDTFEVEEQPDKRLSQVHTYFGQINSLTSLTDKANYRSVSHVINAQAEANYGSAAIKEIFSRWIPAFGRSIADRLGNIMVSRFTDPPRHIKASVLRGSVPEILLGRGYQITSKFLQDATGASEPVNMQVTRLQPAADIIQVEADEVIYTALPEDLSKRNIIIDTDVANINLRTIHDQIYPAPDASVTVICTINPGIRVYSVASPYPAFDVGSWPAGVTIIIYIAGAIRGAGGIGGNYNADTAGDGGTALFTRVPIKLDAASQLWGGGGGGGGTTYGGQASGSNLPSAGGGGAGLVPGAGGAGAATASPGTETAGGAPSGPFFYGGYGGDLGVAGGAGFSGVVGGVFYQGQPGHRGGYAIDGVSLVTGGTWNGTTFTPGALTGSIAGIGIN
jgi:hypothetical protein